MELPNGQVRTTCRRINATAHAHELTFSCHQRFPLLNSDRSRRWFIDALERARKLHRFELWAYVIMPDHAHAILFPQDAEYSISRILQSIKQPVARQATNYLRKTKSNWLEKLRVVRPGGRVEIRFWQQGGGYDRNITDISTL